MAEGKDDFVKTRSWIILLCGVLVVCIGLSLAFLLPGDAAVLAEVRSGGKLIKTVDLRVDQTFTVTTESGGVNVICVQDGKIAVTEASCPDHYCVARGYCNSGAQIVCLPNQLTITFLGETAVDGAVG